MPLTDEVPDLREDHKPVYVVGPPDDDMCATNNASWAAYHASRQENPPTVQTNVSLFPFFSQEVKLCGYDLPYHEQQCDCNSIPQHRTDARPHD